MCGWRANRKAARYKHHGGPSPLSRILTRLLVTSTPLPIRLRSTTPYHEQGLRRSLVGSVARPVSYNYSYSTRAAWGIGTVAVKRLPMFPCKGKRCALTTSPSHSESGRGRRIPQKVDWSRSRLVFASERRGTVSHLLGTLVRIVCPTCTSIEQGWSSTSDADVTVSGAATSVCETWRANRAAGIVRHWPAGTSCQKSARG